MSKIFKKPSGGPTGG